MTTTLRPARSYLYVPGDNAKRLTGAMALGADAVIADLQDGVGPDRKAAARETVRQWLADTPPGQAAGPQRWARIDPRSAEPDCAAVVTAALCGVMVADAELEVLAALDGLLSELEQKRGLPTGSVAVIPLIESASALRDVAAIAHMPRVHRLGIGEVDLVADLGLRPDDGGTELAPHRFAVVLASAAAGLPRPLGPTSTDFRDLERFRTSAEQLLRQGFRARTAIHPAQLSVIHDVFTPTDDEVAAARDVLQRWESAGSGVALDSRGRLIDGAVARIAAETVAAATTFAPTTFARTTQSPEPNTD